MTDKTRLEFEEVFPLPSECWWSEKGSAYCWAEFNVARHPHDELWQVWLASKEKYESSTLTQQQEAEPVGYLSDANAGALREGRNTRIYAEPTPWVHRPVFLNPPKPAAQPQVPDAVYPESKVKLDPHNLKSMKSLYGKATNQEE